MLQKIGIVLLTLGSVLFGYSFIHFGLVADVKELPLLKRWLYWLKGGRGFWDSQGNKMELAHEREKGIRPKWRWRREKTPRIVALILMLIGLILSL